MNWVEMNKQEFPEKELGEGYSGSVYIANPEASEVQHCWPQSVRGKAGAEGRAGRGGMWGLDCGGV